MEAHVYIGELLIQVGGETNQLEAKKYLEKAAETEDAYFRDKAKTLLTKI